MDFSSRLKRLRTEKKLTQEQLGEKISVTKVSVSGYESGNRKPDMDTLQSIAGFFDVSIDYLTGKSDYRNEEELINEQTKTKPSGGMAFYGGADRYTEEEIAIAEAAAKAAIEAYRKGKKKGQEEK